MNRILSVLCLAFTACALKIQDAPKRHLLQLDALQGEVLQTNHHQGWQAPIVCKNSTAKWEKRNSSALREKAKEVKKIYYINVLSAEKRNYHMMAHLKQVCRGIPYERFPAFHAEEIPKNANGGAFKQFARNYSKGRYTPWLKKTQSKEVFAAIHISNYKVMEKILNEDPLGEKSDDIYMVIEDDVVLDPKWKQKLPSILANTPAEWDMLRIGYWGHARCGDAENDYVYAIQPPANDYKAIRSGHFYSGNTGYLVRPKSIPRILDILRNSSFASIENVLMYPHRFPDGTDQQVMSYAVAPEYMLASTMTSPDFQSSHGSR